MVPRFHSRFIVCFFATVVSQTANKWSAFVSMPDKSLPEVHHLNEDVCRAAGEYFDAEQTAWFCTGRHDIFGRSGLSGSGRGGRRRRELLGPRLLREPRGGSAAAGLRAGEHPLQYECQGRRRRRPRARVPNRQSPLTFSGNASATVKADVPLDIAIPLYAFATPVLGGQLTVGMGGMFGHNDTTLAGSVTGTIFPPNPLPPIAVNRSDSINSSLWGFGDLIPLAL